jgi:hypothetical protein
VYHVPNTHVKYAVVMAVNFIQFKAVFAFMVLHFDEGVFSVVFYEK